MKAKKPGLSDWTSPWTTPKDEQEPAFGATEVAEVGANEAFAITAAVRRTRYSIISLQWLRPYSTFSGSKGQRLGVDSIPWSSMYRLRFSSDSGPTKSAPH